MTDTLLTLITWTLLILLCLICYRLRYLPKEDELFLYGIAQNFGDFITNSLYKILKKQDAYNKSKRIGCHKVIISKNEIKKEFGKDE